MQNKYSTALQEHQKNSVVASFIDRLIDEMEATGKLNKEEAAYLRTDGVRQALIAEASNALKKDNASFTLNHLRNPEFLEKLLYTCIATITLGKNLYGANQPEALRLKMLLDKIENFENKQKANNPEFKLKPSDLKKILTADELAELKNLLSPKKASGMKPTPTLTPKADSQLEEDPTTIMQLGLLSKQTGGLAAIITYYGGNLTGIVDMNENDGNAPIDSQNKINEFFSDPEGRNAAIATNLFREGVTGLDSLIEDICNNMHQSPTLHP